MDIDSILDKLPTDDKKDILMSEQITEVFAEMCNTPNVTTKASIMAASSIVGVVVDALKEGASNSSDADAKSFNTALYRFKQALNYHLQDIVAVDELSN
jgi:hypothetical protein